MTDPLPRSRRGSAPSIGGGSRRRAAGPRGPTRGSQASDKYGPSRLGALYEISKLLTLFVETVEQTVLTLLAIITKELPLRNVILIEKTSDRPKTIAWHSPSVSPADLRSAETRAMNSFRFLTGSAASPVGVRDVATGAVATAPEEPAARPERGRFFTCPLVIEGRPIFGVLHLEGSASFDERDVEFASAIANQLATALERYHARLHELALRKQAEASRQEAERESARRRRVEEEVRKLNGELERRVAERTAQFQETIRELESFSYSIAHDLRAPLRHIHGFSKLLLGGGNDRACNDLARRIMATSEKMDGLINDLLAYSRLTLEEVKHEPISPASVLVRIHAEMADELKAHKARLDVEEPLPRVMGDEPSLSRALSNLIQNAVKFASPGVAPHIVVKAEPYGDRVRLWVEDNGIGIAPEYHERIFRVFQRLHKAEDYPGTGIGLAIVRRAMERMKGRSGVESRLGGGSRFWLELEKASDS